MPLLSRGAETGCHGESWCRMMQGCASAANVPHGFWWPYLEWKGLCAFDFCIGVELWYPGQEPGWVIHESWGCNDCDDGHNTQCSDMEADSLGESLSWTKQDEQIFTGLNRIVALFLFCFMVISSLKLIRDSVELKRGSRTDPDIYIRIFISTYHDIIW